MRAIVKSLSRSVSRPSSAWLTLLLLLVVLAPSVCLLWFVNQAVKNERLAVRQKLVDAYRGHLVLAQQRLESYWRDMADDLDAQAETLSPPALFAKQVFAGVADAVICFDAAGNVVYPGAALPGISEPADKRWTEAQQMESGDLAGAAKAFAIVAQQATDTGLAARAWQAQARCLVREGKKEEALAVLLGPLAEEQYQHTTDAQGRLLVPNAQLMALELLNDTDSGRASVLCARLKRQLSDYDDLSISAAQRRFLMRELQRFDPDQAILAMLSAEDLAAAYIEAGQSENGLQAGTKGTTPHPGPLPFRRGEGESSTASLQSESHPHSQEEDKPAAGHAAQPELRATSLPGVWQFASSRGRVVLLYKGTEALLARIAGPAGLKNLPSDVVVTLLPPGREAEGFFVSLPAGPTLPDWRLALALKDQKLFDAATDQRVASYVWIGVLVVAGVIVLALLILRLVRRQMALTKLRNDLVANVTHELKTPLSGMRLLVDTLLNSPKLHEPTVREYLALIAKENLRLSRLIDNFLAFSRMERNKYTLDFNEVPARAIVEGAAAAVQERFNAPDCRFQVQMASNLPPIVADADAMVTAVVNLLDNAWKYSGDEKQITLTAAADNGSVIFAVQDNGIGLSPRDTKRIFKRFYQVDQRLARSAGGCGLGLSIVKFIVTAHGGAVKVESELGRGSRFMLVLPGRREVTKSEGRNPKAEGNPKSEIRMSKDG